MQKEFLILIFLKYFLLIVGKKSRLEFPMRQRLHLKLFLISSTVTISMLTLLFMFVILKEAVKESVAFSSPRIPLGLQL